jgi:tRNA-guanine transglycosylase
VATLSTDCAYGNDGRRQNVRTPYRQSDVCPFSASLQLPSKNTSILHLIVVVDVVVHIDSVVVSLAASFRVIIMSETKNGDSPQPFKKLKTEENPSSLYQPEPIQPEWLELPPELREDYENSDGSSTSAAWNKYFPYTTSAHLPVVPLDQSPTFTPESPALCFQVHGICGRARAGTLHFPNGGPPVPTPRFMPVGTKGTLKGVLPSEIADMECPIILANTYHLAIQPGTDLIDEVFGGLPKFMGSIIPSSNDEGTATKTTKRMFNLLTDSGGFQMVSLAALSQVTEKGVLFESPYTGKPMLLKPEDSIRCQNQIGADIIMQLDDVISSVTTDDDRFRIATFRTLRWYDRCVQAHKFPERQNLYPIMQGALDVSKGGLRELCIAGFRHRDTQQKRIPGFGIGGLAGGESKGEFWKVVDHACRHLPDDRPRYLMGVGYPLDLVVCSALGVDQYDW